jgi:filamentous hemagglutinin
VTITGAEESNQELHLTQQKKSGLSGTGGIGFSYGTQDVKVTDTLTATTHRGSTVGSVQGSLSIRAGGDLKVQGSELVAGQDMLLTGKNVVIETTRDSSTQTHTVEQKTSGLTLALSGTAGSALNTAVSTVREAKREGNDRLAALQGVRAALTGVGAAQAVALDGAQGAAPQNNNTVGVTLSYGSQKSVSEQRQSSSASRGSGVMAGRDLTIRSTEGDISIEGSQLRAGNNAQLDASRDLILKSGENTSALTGRNESHGSTAGVGIGVGTGGWGLQVSAGVSQGRGHESGSGLTHSESRLTAGNNVTLASGRDTQLTGAQVSGGSVKVNAGRDLLLRSEQDRESYESKQQSVSAGGSVAVLGGGGSGGISMSREKMNSEYASVREQTGIAAGKGGFEISAGRHTQLDGAVIASAAEADKNSLSTGTLGWSAIRNRAEYEAEQQSAGLSSGGGGLGEQFVGNMANSLLSGVKGGDSAGSVTQSAISAGSITVRDAGQQRQDTAGLSRDTENANQALEQIFDREKEQQRLKEAQLIGEIGSQAADIARTQENIAATKEANERLASATEAERAAAKAEWEKAHPDRTATAEDISGQLYQDYYDQAYRENGQGTGGRVQQAIQAVTAAMQGLAGGNLAQAVSGAAGPYLAEQIHRLAPDEASRAMAHAVVGAVTSWAAGNDAAAGAAGAVSGEVMGQLVMKQLYPGRKAGELTEAEKQTISALGTLAAGLAGGLAGGNTAGAVAGAQTGKNAVENNALSGLDSLGKGMMDYGQAAASWNQYAEANGLTPEQKQAGLDKLAKGDLPESANITKVIVDGYKDGVLMAGAGYLGPAASVGKVIGGAVIAEIANGSYQWFDMNKPGNENKTWDYKGSASAGITGALAPGRGLWQNVGIAAGGAVFTDGPDVGAVGSSAAGAWAGGMFGKYAPGSVEKITGGKHIPEFIYDVIGSGGAEVIGGFTKDAINATPGNKSAQESSKK